MNRIALALAAAASFAAIAAAAPPRPAAPPPPAGEEVSIPFVHFRGIQDFEADGENGVYLQDRSRNWYYAKLIGPCRELPWAIGMGVDTRGSPSFDRFSTLIVDHERCPLQSLVRSGPPPGRHHGKKGS